MMPAVSRENLLIIDRLRTSPQNTATLYEAIGGGLPHHTGDAYLGLAIFNLIKVGIIDLVDDDDNSRSREVLNSISAKETGQPILSYGYDIARSFIEKYGASWRVRLTRRIFDLQETLGFSVTGLIARHSHNFTFDAAPAFRTPSQHLRADVFVLMPFEESLSSVFDDHIKPVCVKLGFTVQRADEIFSSGNVIDDVFSMIFNSKIIIADCTSRNSNVFYEMGIADTIGKRVILITKNRDDIPFDIRHKRFIEYAFTPRGMKEFEFKLKKYLTAKVWTYTDDHGVIPASMKLP